MTIPTAPIRIQLSRARGWRMPPNTVNVARPGMWGNPFIVGEQSGVFPAEMVGVHGKAEIIIPMLTIEQVLDFYRSMILGHLSPEMYPCGHEWFRNFQRHNGGHPGEAVRHLRGKNLACFCSLSDPCHADVLLEIANR